MCSEDTDNNVYEFLEKECRYFPELWKEFGEGIISHTKDANFWDELSDHLDCLRVCSECRMPMIEGYVVNGCDTYCSDKCLHNHLTDEEFNELYNDGNGDTYWTTWYEESETWKSVAQ